MLGAVGLRQLHATLVARAPELSIGVPVYNGARYVREAIECVLSQARDFEVIRRGTSCSGSGVGLSPATGHRSRIR